MGNFFSFLLPFFLLCLATRDIMLPVHSSQNLGFLLGIGGQGCCPWHHAIGASSGNLQRRVVLEK